MDFLAKTMTYYIIKILITTTLVILISEITKRSSFMGSLLASLPLTSYLAMIWLYVDTANVEKVAGLSTGIFWLVIPSLSLFLLLPLLLKKEINFYFSLGISTLLMILFYFTMVFFLNKVGVKI